MKTFLKLTIALFAFMFFAGAVAEATGADVQTVMEITAAVSVASVGVRLAFKSTKPSGLAYLVTMEIWEDFIASNLFKTYDWMKRAKDRTGRVINGTIVHIPQAGATVSTLRNREVYPVPMVQRNDSDITYVIDRISSDATRIDEAEKVEVSYDKVMDVFGDHVGAIGMGCAQNTLYRWLGKGIATGANLAAGKVVRTTGSAVATHLAGSTGNRKKLLAADIATGKTALVLATKREQGNRAAIMSEDMYNQLKADSTITNKDTMDQYGAVWKDGDLVKLHGFDIIRTDVVPRFTNASPPVAKDSLDPTVLNAAADNDVVALIDFGFVHTAKGDIKFYETLNDALAQGDVYSATVRLGASRERADDAGVVAVVQDASA